MELELIGRNGRRYAALRERKKASVRRREGLFVAEGLRVVGELLASALEVETMIFDPERLARPEMQDLLRIGRARGIRMYACSAADLNRLADTEQPQGVIAWGRILPEQPLQLTGRRYAWLDRCADPGNLGAILRSLDYFAFAGLLLGPGSVDPWHPKVIRAAAGARFRRPVWPELPFAQVAAAFREGPGEIIALEPSGGQSLDSIDPSGRWLLVLGPETGGLHREALSGCDRIVTIPGSPAAESLNLAVACSIAAWHFRDAGPPAAV